MPDIGKVEILLAIAAVCSIGVLDLINRWKNGEAYRKLKKIKNPSRMTLKILNECKQLLDPLWWHWAMLCLFIFSLLGIAIDTN